jgi:hypothetical protein
MQVQVGNPFAEHVQKDELGGGLLLQRGGGQGQRLTEGPRFLPVEVLDMGDMASGFQVGEAEQLRAQRHGGRQVPSAHTSRRSRAASAAAGSHRRHSWPWGTPGSMPGMVTGRCSRVLYALAPPRRVHAGEGGDPPAPGRGAVMGDRDGRPRTARV